VDSWGYYSPNAGSSEADEEFHDLMSEGSAGEWQRINSAEETHLQAASNLAQQRVEEEARAQSILAQAVSAEAKRQADRAKALAEALSPEGSDEPDAEAEAEAYTLGNAEAEASHRQAAARAARPVRAQVEQSFIQTKASEVIEFAKANVANLKIHAGEAVEDVKLHLLDVYRLATTTRLGVTVLLAIAGAALGGIFGALVGSLVGFIIGLMLAIFTFGFSIPVGVAIGFGLGATGGATIGAVSGGAIGFGAFTYRKELRAMSDEAVVRLQSSAKYVQTKAQSSATCMSESWNWIVRRGPRSAGTGAPMSPAKED